jgi:hypothetical protein
VQEKDGYVKQNASKGDKCLFRMTLRFVPDSNEAVGPSRIKWSLNNFLGKMKMGGRTFRGTANRDEAADPSCFIPFRVTITCDMRTIDTSVPSIL